jgi:hypothetical protein
MAALVDRPGLLLVVSFAGFLLAALLGVVAQRVWSPVRAGDENELTIVQTAALTLLGLIVGFSISMAVSRYDQRKNLEEAEANGKVPPDSGPSSQTEQCEIRSPLRCYWRARYILIFAAMSSTASPVTSTRAFFTVPVKANGGL